MKRETKQVLVIRRDLKCRRGKEIAQACHASMKVLLNEMRHDSDGNTLDWILSTKEDSDIEIWLKGLFTKICVYVNSEQELVDLEIAAKAAGLRTALIVDSGKTEFHGVPTKTVLAIGPNWSDEIDALTRDLPLL